MRMNRRTMIAGLMGACANGASKGLRAGVFQSDATPEMGEPLIWVTPTSKVLDPLLAKGVVLDDGERRFVLCALDWCGIGNSTHLLFRSKIARAAGIPVDQVTVHTLHQHTAPYVDGDAYAIMRKLPKVPRLMSDAFLERVTDRLGDAVRAAMGKMQPFDSVGTGQARVERVASARRFLSDEGKPITRYSTGGSDPKMAALPEGDIDPMLRTITLAEKTKPIVRLHYYATHPQTWCCDGVVSGDMVASARASAEKQDGVPQIYFTGCSGDVTVGKYNDRTAEAKQGLGERLAKGMMQSAHSTKYEPAKSLRWRVAPLHLTPKLRAPASTIQELEASIASGKLTDEELYRSSIDLAFARRKTPLQTILLEIGNAGVLHLPGEPMNVFQKYALGLRPDRFLAVAGYGDIAPGYLCTDRAESEGGYEPGASNAGPGVEAALKSAIRDQLTG